MAPFRYPLRALRPALLSESSPHGLHADDRGRGHELNRRGRRPSLRPDHRGSRLSEQGLGHERECRGRCSLQGHPAYKLSEALAAKKAPWLMLLS